MIPVVLEVGMQIGDLTIIGESHHREGHVGRFYMCRCKCGYEFPYTASRLKNKKVSKCRPCRIEELKLPMSKLGAITVGRQYKHTAKRNGRLFELTDEEFSGLIGSDCFYCGLPSSESNKIVLRGRGEFRYNGVDRMDNTQGYTTSNSVPCCVVCNKAKRDLTYEIFMKWIVRISHRHRS